MVERRSLGIIPGTPENPEKAADSQKLSVNDRLRNKFRNAVGAAMEDFYDDELRAGLEETQQRIFETLKSTGIYEVAPEEVIEKVEDALIEEGVKRYFAEMAYMSIRKLNAILEQENIKLKDEVKAALEELKNEVCDDLTGLVRDKYLKAGLKKTISMRLRDAMEAPKLISVVFIDLDHFKNVNDTYGHAAGDKVLKTVGKVIRDKFQRDTDILGRYGGEELMLVLPDCKQEDAERMIDELREEINAIKFTAENGKFNVTFTAGLLTAILHKGSHKAGNADAIQEIITEESDQLLYEGKETRNCTVSKQIPIGDYSEESGEHSVLT